MPVMIVDEGRDSGVEESREKSRESMGEDAVSGRPFARDVCPLLLKEKFVPFAGVKAFMPSAARGRVVVVVVGCHSLLG